MKVIINKCPKCNGTEYTGDTWIMWNATFGMCAKCNKCAIVLQSSPEYEQYLAKEVEIVRETKQPPTVTCPYCQSTDTKKISGTSRFMSTGIFGLASKKIGKNYHCNKCKSDF